MLSLQTGPKGSRLTIGPSGQGQSEENRGPSPWAQLSLCSLSSRVPSSWRQCSRGQLGFFESRLAQRNQPPRKLGKNGSGQEDRLPIAGLTTLAFGAVAGPREGCLTGGIADSRRESAPDWRRRRDAREKVLLRILGITGLYNESRSRKPRIATSYKRRPSRGSTALCNGGRE